MCQACCPIRGNNGVLIRGIMTRTISNPVAREVMVRGGGVGGGGGTVTRSSPEWNSS